MQSPPAPRFGLVALAFLALALLAVGCDGASDPLEPIRRAQAEGRVVETLEPLRALLEGAPADWEDAAEAHVLYARAVAESGRPQLATWALRRAMEDPDWEIEASFMLGSLGLSVGDYHQAAQAAERILAREPDDVDALLLRASAYARWRVDPHQAVADARRAAELDPGNSAVFEPLILALLALEDEEGAAEALAELGAHIAETDAPAETQAWHCATLASFHNESGRKDEALAKWNECLEGHPTDPTVVSMAIQFFERRQERERALAILRAAHEAQPENRSFRLGLSQRLDRMGESEEAEALLVEATQAEDPQLVALAWIDLSGFRHRKGDPEAAADALREAWELAQREGAPSPQLTFQYADMLVMSGDHERALELARGMSADAYRHLIRARVAQQRGDLEGALGEFEAGNRLWPNNATARYYTARAAEVLGDFDRAVEEYRNSVRIDADATNARVRGARLLSLAGRTEEANQVLFAQTPGAPLDLEGDLLALRLGGLRGERRFVVSYLIGATSRRPAQRGALLAAAADGLAQGDGPEAALQLIDSIEGIDLTAAGSAPALRALVRHAHAAGEPGRAARAVEAALAASPDEAALHEVRGLHLELTGAVAEARAAYQRAVELAPEDPAAWTGLGRVAESTEAALEAFDRAVALDENATEPRRLAAQALAEAGDAEKAIERLDALLRIEPQDPEAFRLRAALDLERGVASGQTLARARGAVWLGGGAPALELLARVHAARGEPEPAARASERARALREEPRPPESKG